MDLLRVGPDGALLLFGVIMSAVVAVLSWRRVSWDRAGAATVAVAAALVVWQLVALRDINHPILVALFVFVPSAILFGASRMNWLARHAWVLLLVGPIAFVVCYVGICECYFRVIAPAIGVAGA